jgi:dTDP-4-dehydrorhamnose reductase
MKILITGINGQVGHALMQQLTDHELIGLTRQDCDLTNPDQIKQVIDQHQPDLIINPAAYTKVDQAEDEPELAFQINRDAPKVMAEKAREYNIPLIHFSTDYVFDGEKEGLYRKGCDESLGSVWTIKACWRKIYSRSGRSILYPSYQLGVFEYRSQLLPHMKRLSTEQKEIKVVSDQIGVPTSNQFLAEQVQQIIPSLIRIIPASIT